jgi:signal transduction histidine kinase/ActR/RegA family two-component response regulator
MESNLLRTIRESFRFKVILIGILFILIGAFSFMAFFVHEQRTFLNDSLMERGKLLARVLARSAKVGIFSENSGLLMDPIETIAMQKEVVGVSVFNAEGKPLSNIGASQSEPPPQPGLTDGWISNELSDRLSKSKSPICLSTKGGLEVWSAVFSAPSYAKEESLFYQAGNSRRQDKVIGFVNITISNETLNIQLYSLMVKAVLIAIGAAIIGSLLIFFAIKGITRPLDTLTRGIKALGDEDAVEKIPIETEDEIGRLAIAFNDMAESLKNRKAENLQLEMQLRQSQKFEALGTLAGGIAHDFNNVLSPIFGYTEMAMDGVPEDGQVYNDLKEVRHAAIRARDLVKQILAFSRQAESERTPLKIQFVIKEALKLLRASLPTTITITRAIDEECGPVLADPTGIHRIVMNLCTNAYHAMREKGGQLKVALEESRFASGDRVSSLDWNPGPYVKLTVSDTGHGMDDDVQQRIFDPYFTTKPPGEGTGMGLAVVHGIVKSFGGDIFVQSEIGKGTTFEIYFPRIESKSESAEDLFAESIQGGHERILLVDDEVQIVQMLKQMLEQLGYYVTARTSSIEALQAFKTQPDNFDLIITDQTMPIMTGDQLATELMRIRKEIPVIVCTGFSERITEEKARTKGIRAILMKPVVKQELARNIRKALAVGKEASTSTTS